MSNSYPYEPVQDYSAHSYPLNAASIWSWDHQQTALPPRGNMVHVNPAFYQPPVPVVNPTTTKVIINPKFFPSIQHEKTVVEPSPAINVNSVSNSRATQAVVEKKPLSAAPVLKPITKYRSLNVNINSRNKYSWKKADTQVVKPTTRTPVKSPKISSKHKYSAVKLMTSPRISSTPLRVFSNSRFKVDNRLKKKFASKVVRPSPAKIVQTKYRLIIKRSLKCNVARIRNSSNRSTVNRSFTNFRTPLKTRSLVVRNMKKTNSKAKAPKKKEPKSCKRYYNNETQIEETKDDEDDEVEITEKPSSSVKSRKPIGSLPSFITLWTGKISSLCC